MTYSLRRFIAVQLTAAVVLAPMSPPDAGAQAPAGGTRLGVFPWVDASGSGARSAGVAASQTLIDELAKGSRLVGIAIDAAALPVNGAIDQSKAIALGKEHAAAYVFVGTVTEASSRESTRGGWLPKVKGSQVHLTVRSIEAKTVLEGTLYDVASGERLLSVTTKGSHRDKAYTGRVWSSWGSWDVGDNAAFLASPLGKAFLEATREMVKKIDEAAISHTASRN